MILRVTGRGVSLRPADKAEVRLVVSCVNKTCALASEGANGTVKVLGMRLRERGFDEKGLKATSFDISPYYKEVPEHRREQAGYSCRIALRFALDFTPEALSLAVEALSEGAEELSIAFSVKDAEAVRQEAVRSAWADASLQAQLFAEASGLTVGEVKEATLDFNGVRAMNFAGAAALSVRSARMDFTPDDVRTEATLSVQFELN